jgi:hypothetical protein
MLRVIFHTKDAIVSKKTFLLIILDLIWHAPLAAYYLYARTILPYSAERATRYVFFLTAWAETWLTVVLIMDFFLSIYNFKKNKHPLILSLNVANSISVMSGGYYIVKFPPLITDCNNHKISSTVCTAFQISGGITFLYGVIFVLIALGFFAHLANTYCFPILRNCCLALTKRRENIRITPMTELTISRTNDNIDVVVFLDKDEESISKDLTIINDSNIDKIIDPINKEMLIK